MSERQGEEHSIRTSPSPRKTGEVEREETAERRDITTLRGDGGEEVEGERGGEEEGEREEEGTEKARDLASLQSAFQSTPLEEINGEQSLKETETETDSQAEDAEAFLPLSFRRRSGAFSRSSSETSQSGTSSLRGKEQLLGSFERANHVSSPAGGDEERQVATPTITVTVSDDDVKQEGEREGGGGREGESERGSLYSSDTGNNRTLSPGELATPPESEGERVLKDL